MDIETFNRAKCLEEKINQVTKVIDVVENKTYNRFCFALSVESIGGKIPFTLPEEMTKDILYLCKHYKLNYEKQFIDL